MFEEAKCHMQMCIHENSHFGLNSPLFTLLSTCWGAESTRLESGGLGSLLWAEWFGANINNFTAAVPPGYLSGSSPLWSLRLYSSFSVRDVSSAHLPTAHVLLIFFSFLLISFPLIFLLFLSFPLSILFPHSSLFLSPWSLFLSSSSTLLFLFSCFSLSLPYLPPCPVPPSRCDPCYPRASMAHQMLVAIFFQVKGEKEGIKS